MICSLLSCGGSPLVITIILFAHCFIAGLVYFFVATHWPGFTYVFQFHFFLLVLGFLYLFLPMTVFVAHGLGMY